MLVFNKIYSHFFSFSVPNWTWITRERGEWGKRGPSPSRRIVGTTYKDWPYLQLKMDWKITRNWNSLRGLRKICVTIQRAPAGRTRTVKTIMTGSFGTVMTAEVVRMSCHWMRYWQIIHPQIGKMSSILKNKYLGRSYEACGSERKWINLSPIWYSGWDEASK